MPHLGTYNYQTGEARDTHGVLLGQFPSSNEAEQAMQAARLPHAFWDRTAIAPIPLLQQLRDWVIATNERRLPKWKFRFAQIHPRLTRAHTLLLEGVAVRTENVSAHLFTTSAALRAHPHPYWWISFRLFGEEGKTEWSWKATSARRGKGCPSAGLIELRRCLIEGTLRPKCFTLTLGMMLSPSCLRCGKALTDPISIARWVGPECWGSVSTHMPRLLAAKYSENSQPWSTTAPLSSPSSFSRSFAARAIQLSSGAV